jgi:hypothetical protein
MDEPVADRHKQQRDLHNSNAHKQTPSQQKESDMNCSFLRDFNFWMFIATAFIAIATAFYAHYAMKQWGIMSEQLKQMKDSSTQTDKLINETHTLAQAAKDQVKLTQSQVEQTQTLNRPLPGVRRLKVDRLADEVRQISVVIKNFGKLAARNVSIGWKVDRLKRNKLENSTGPVTLAVVGEEIKGVSLDWNWHPSIALPPEQEIDSVLIMFSKSLFIQNTQGYDAIRVRLAVKYTDTDSKTQVHSCTYLITRMASPNQEDPEILLSNSTLDVQ